MSGENELKPCPFCSGSARYLAPDQNFAGVNMVMCNGCGCRNYEANAEKWNRRATPPGYEMVPEGTMNAVIAAATELAYLIVQCRATPGGSVDRAHKACAEIIKAHRATQKKETPNAQG